MPSPSTRRTAIARCVIAGAVLLALVGCTAAAEPGTPPGSMKEPARVAVSLELPDLGVLPVADPPLTDAESEKARLEQAEEAWQQLLVRYPTAVRPEVSFGYVTDETRVEIMRACLSAAGLPIDEGRDADGHVVSIGTSTTNEAEAIAQYSCVTAHPTRIVWAGPNEAERGWFYDYLTEFTAPCLAANGIETEPPPTREEFIATWPNQGWYPAVGMSADAAWDASLEAACPSANGTIADILAAHDTRR